VHIARRLRAAARTEDWLSRAAMVELKPVVALCMCALTLWGFVELADEVVEGSTREIDTAVLLALRTPDDPADPLGPRWLEEMGRDVTALGGVGVLALLTSFGAGFLWMSGKRRVALFLLASVAGALVTGTVLKGLFDRPRPDLVPHATYVVTKSFPSGHSMMSAATYLTIGTLLARVQVRRRLKVYILGVATFLALLVGASRVYLGVHWPSDVLGGWALGSAWALACWIVARRLQLSGGLESVPSARERR
jgi:undecaprenyl-diphosphatase